MALIRVAQYSSTPTVVADYQAQNAHLQAFTNQLLTQQFILDSGTAQPVIKQGCYVSHGGSLYVADADTSISGSPADGSVYIRVSGTTTLTAEFVTDISGYTWNPVYTALTNGSYTLLPYLIVKAGTVWTRYNFNPNNQSFGIVKTTGLDTGSGAMTFDQDLKTTASPTFADLNVPSNFVSIGDFHYLGVDTGEPVSGEGDIAFNESIICPASGGFRCTATIHSGYYSSSYYGYMSFVVKKNDTEVYRYDQSGNVTETKTYDVTFVKGDKITILVYLRDTASNSYGNPSGSNIYFSADHVKNIGSLYDSMYKYV